MKKLLVVISLFLVAATVYGECPDWSFNASDFEFTMSLTGVITVNGEEVRHTNAKIAAFVDGEVRGVASPTFFPLPTPDGRYTFGMTINSNSASGENVTFKLCLNNGECISTSGYSTTFQANAIVGSDLEPVSVGFACEVSYTLTMAVDPVGGGTTTPAVGDHSYAEGTVVDITATPAAGYRFDSWTGNVADQGNATTTVTMNADETVTANFVKTYTLTMAVAPSGLGTTTPAVGSHVYDEGEQVTITATPIDANTDFTGWTGDVADPNSATTTVTMNGDKEVTANFKGITHMLTMAVAPAGGGTTTPAVGDHEYDKGAVVDITATPAAGYRFDSWTGDVANSGSASTTVTMDEDKTVTANFVKTYTLTMAVTPTGLGTTTPAVGSHVYDEGEQVTITATPIDVNTEFTGWTGDVADPNSSTTTVTMNSDKEVTANFKGITYTLTMAVTPAGGGTTTPAVGDHVYGKGTAVDITATPAAGYRFDSWTGNVANPSSATTTVTMNADETVTANFVKTYTLTMAVSPVGLGTTTPAVGSHVYDEGEQVTIIATPKDADTEFTGWTGDVADPSSATTTVTMTGDKEVTANFKGITYTLTMAVAPAGGGTTTPAVGDHVYGKGTVVDITATPATGYRFVSWSDNVAEPTNKSTTVTMDGDKTVTATFEPIPQYTLTMVAGPGGTTDPTPGPHVYYEGEEVTITAIPSSGYIFAGWVGDVANTANEVTTVTIDGDKTVTANFKVPIPGIQVTPRAIAYGAVVIGDSKTENVTVKNVGDATLNVSGTLITETPTQATDAALAPVFSIVEGGAPIDVAPGKSHVIKVAFAPNSTRDTTAVLKISSNAQFEQTDAEDDYVVDVQLSGKGIYEPPEGRFFATPTSGYPALIVQFNEKSEGNPTAWSWDFGDGQTSTERNPVHGYYVPGIYDVTLTITTYEGKFEYTKKEFIKVWGDGPLCHAPLALVDNSSASVKEGWDASIDNDISGWVGTTSTDDSPPFAIYEFKDGTTKSINKVQLQANTEVRGGGWVNDFSVHVSTTGINDGDFTKVLQGYQKTGDWETFSFDAVDAKYIKLVIESPTSGWRRLGEFRVCPVRAKASASKSSVAVTSPHVGNGVEMAELTMTVMDKDGVPVTGLTKEDFYLYILNAKPVFYDIVETATPGVYKTGVGNLGGGMVKVEIMVNGVLIDTKYIEFTPPVLTVASLDFVEGSETYKGEGWDNAIDGVTSGWDGTVTAKGPDPYAIFAFSDGGTKAVQKVNLLVDTDVGYGKRWAQRFRIQVSTTGTAATDFTTVYDGIQTEAKWQSHLFTAANAKYVKIIIDYPETGHIQVGELEIEVGDALLAKNGASGLAADGLVSLSGVPDEFVIHDNYPNPFNPTTSIEFGLPTEENVTILVFNQIGQLIRTLYDNQLSAGYHTITWNGLTDSGESVPSGTYFLRFTAGEFSSTQKMMMLK